MKILNFKVVGVRGFLTKEIPFRDSVTFLIGINGSGKTTLLELMSGLLTPTLKKLLTRVLKNRFLTGKEKIKIVIITLFPKVTAKVIVRKTDRALKKDLQQNN